MPNAERKWQQRYQKSSSFQFTPGVKAKYCPWVTSATILLEDWEKWRCGTIFVSIPTLLDLDLAPAGYHIIHSFTPSWIEDWQVFLQVSTNKEGGGSWADH